MTRFTMIVHAACVLAAALMCGLFHAVFFPPLAGAGEAVPGESNNTQGSALLQTSQTIVAKPFKPQEEEEDFQRGHWSLSTTFRSTVGFLNPSVYVTLCQDLALFWVGLCGFVFFRAWAAANGHGDDDLKAKARREAEAPAPIPPPPGVVGAMVQKLYADNKERLRGLRSERSSAAKPPASAAATADGDLWGCTSLHVAADCGAVATVEALLDSGAHADVTDTWDETPLHFAARGGSVEVCELLLARRAEIDAVNAHGRTPLLLAGDAGREEVCEFLVSRGAGVAGGASDAELPPAVTAALLRRMLGDSQPGSKNTTD